MQTVIQSSNRINPHRTNRKGRPGDKITAKTPATKHDNTFLQFYSSCHLERRVSTVTRGTHVTVTPGYIRHDLKLYSCSAYFKSIKNQSKSEETNAFSLRGVLYDSHSHSRLRVNFYLKKKTRKTDVGCFIWFVQYSHSHSQYICTHPPGRICFWRYLQNNLQFKMTLSRHR